MPTAVIVDALRSPLGKRGGGLAATHPADLLAQVLGALVARHDLDPAVVDDVIVGCVMQVGAQSNNVGRTAVLAAGWPESVPATTVDRQCGSSQQALHFAAQGVIAGAYDVVVAAGVENMSMVPMGASAKGKEFGAPASPRYKDRYRDADGKVRLVPQGVSAEYIAREWGIDRAACDAFSVRSHQRAARAQDEGRFDRELVPIQATPAGEDGGGPVEVGRDEGVRPDSSMETLGRLKPAFLEDGVVTPGSSSQITDGASAALIMTEERAEHLGLTPRARFHAGVVAGVDPVMMLTGPIPATRKLLDRTGMALDAIDVVEINEAFAPIVLAWEQELKPDMERVNPNGGAIALGHPLGASGGRLLATLLSELERSGGRWGLQTMCEGGGMANALVVERLG
jgi:acetyl-CoA acyltransferase